MVIDLSTKLAADAGPEGLVSIVALPRLHQML
uniref:Uncharacterized protein n=1 Tax=Rhizophora mucronata TaxID=61149 RepID=A0A2P2JLB9_RHIMU